MGSGKECLVSYKVISPQSRDWSADVSSVSLRQSESIDSYRICFCNWLNIVSFFSARFSESGAAGTVRRQERMLTPSESFVALISKSGSHIRSAASGPA